MTGLRLVVLLFAATVLDGADRPNIVLILADDLAWSDLGCYGSTRCETANLDRLARQGMRFTDAYAAAPICSPSRAALITGKTPARLNFEFVTKWRTDVMPTGGSRKVTPPPYTYDLPLEERTIAEALRDAGYRTGIAGKWHLNSHHQTYLGWSPKFGPLQQGFEWGRETFGSHPWAFRGQDDPYEEVTDGAYGPDSLTDDAIDFLSQDDEKPFFLYVAYPYVHTPVHARGSWLKEKYRKKLGPSATDKQVLYGGFVETLDHHVGRLVDAVDRLGLAEDTLIVFTSDNGGHPEYAVNAPLRGSKWNLYEGGIRVPLIVRWPSEVETGTTSGVPVSGTDWFATLAEAAGAADTAPDSMSLLELLRGGATEPFEQRELIFHFPYYHPEKGYDEMPPEIGVADGFISQTKPVSAIRVGQKKLLYFWEDGRTELYDLDGDPSREPPARDRRSRPEGASPASPENRPRPPAHAADVVRLTCDARLQPCRRDSSLARSGYLAFRYRDVVVSLRFQCPLAAPPRRTSPASTPAPGLAPTANNPGQKSKA